MIEKALSESALLFGNTNNDIIRFTIIMAENVVTHYDPHFHLGMRVMTLIWCFRGWQVCK
jgi:hypothetical protein